MNESFLHYIWKHKLLKASDLKTMNNEAITIIHTGNHNTNAGPDFLQAKIKIGNVILVGNIEIHLHTSDFEKHHHQHDENYKNLILHVVYQHDKNININCPTLCLEKIIPLYLLRNFEQLQQSKDAIPCSNLIHHISDFKWKEALQRYSIERLERKIFLVEEILKQNDNNWEETFYQMLTRNFGMKVNGEAFFELAKSLPIKILSKHKNSLMQLEAMLIGQSGMLNEIFSDTYAIQLQKEYQFLQHKHELKPIPKALWKMARMRPQNFPPLRLAQLAALIYEASHLFSKIIEATDLKTVIKLFETAPSNYWQSHYRLDASSTKSKKQIGNSTIENIIINTIVPILFAYAKFKNNDDLQNKAIDWLEQLSAEKNAIILDWKKLNIKASNAADTQALIELKNEYCNKKRCTECMIGMNLMQQNN
ncbi:MAG: hypothetical protein RJA07_2474 [Bacteroidota bacterium]